MRKLSVDEKSVGLRADVYVAGYYPRHSRSTISHLFDEGCVSINKNPIKPSRKLHSGDKLSVDDSALDQTPTEIDLPIIYEDKNVIVINKPAGILTHSKGGFNNEGTVASFIKPRLDRVMVGNRAGIVHRLDRATSGVIICAKNSATQTFLQKQFGNRKTKKCYLAVVEGVPSPEEALIDAPIERNPKKPQTFRVGSAGKTAQTKYKILKMLNKSSISESLLELWPTTGRTHQLRVHLKYINHPIVGDAFYGRGAEYMLLHALSLELTIPKGDRRVFRAEPPEYFNKYV